MLSSCRPSAFRQAFGDAASGPDLPDQLAIAADAAQLPPQWPRLPFGHLWVAHHPRLPLQQLASPGGSSEVILLGTLIDPEACTLNALQWTPPDQGLFPAVERRLQTLGGRYVCLARCGSRLRLYLDASGSLSMLFSAEHGMAASTVALFPDGGQADDATELIEALDLGRQNGFVPFGLTPRQALQRLLPNHLLNLESWKARRHWPPAAVKPASDPEAALAELATLLRHTVLAVLEAGHRPWLSLTAGYDSRLLLALMREQREAIDWFTWALPDANAEQDVALAQRLAAELGLPHQVIPFQAATPRGQALWMHRSGLAVGELRGMSLASTMAAMGPSRYYLPALGSEVGRARFWREGDDTHTALSAPGLLRRLRLPQQPLLLGAARRWLRQLEVDDSLQVLDLLHLEQRLGCWAGVTAYGDATGPIRVQPFSNRRIVELLLSLPASMRREDGVPRALIHRWWPELLRYPINGEPLPPPQA